MFGDVKEVIIIIAFTVDSLISYSYGLGLYMVQV